MSGAEIARMARPEAIEIAKAFVADLEGTYDQLIVAGSLRRKMGYVHDIEIVAVPKVETIRQVTRDLFDTVTVETPVDLLDGRMTELLGTGTVTKRLDAAGSPRWGPLTKYLNYRGARIDLFTPCADRFGWILLLGTGPQEFSRQLVVPQQDDHGRKLRTKDGRPGLLPPHIRPKDGWLTFRTSGERIETSSEPAVFDLFELPYRPPWERE